MGSPDVIGRKSSPRLHFVVDDDINERKMAIQRTGGRRVTPTTLASDAADAIGAQAVLDACRLDAGVLIVRPRRSHARARLRSKALVA